MDVQAVGTAKLAESWAGPAVRRPTPRGWRAPLAGAAGLAAAAGMITVADPFKHHLTPPCPFHALTGLWCPLCGATRAVWAAAHGHFGLMVHANLLLPLILVGAGWGWLSWLGRSTGWWRLPVPRGRAFNISIVIVLVAFTALRNLPGMGALAPPRLS